MTENLVTVKFHPEESGAEVDPELIKMVPGHIAYEDAEAAAHATTCDHRWILHEERSAKCLLCDGVRELTDRELEIIDHAQKAGVSFLKWDQRLAHLAKFGGTGKGRKKRKRGSRKRGPSTSAVKDSHDVPEGFLPTKEASEKLGIERKKLRKMARDGRYEAVKVGGRVYIKVEE